MKCEVCGENPHKYRCPVCRIVYCSLSCYKQHKAEDSCQPAEGTTKVSTEERQSISKETPVEKIEKEDGEVFSNDEGSDQEMETEIEDNTDQLKPEQLKELDDSEKLKSLLQNPHLRDLIRQVDQASDKRSAIEGAMQEPLFVEFADVCLTTTNGDAQTTSAER